MTPGVPPSFVAGTSSRPLLYLTVDAVLRRRWRRRRDGRRWSCRSSRALSLRRARRRGRARRARAARPAGSSRGDRVGIWAPNCAEWVLTMFAAARAGLILVNINPAYRTSELDFALRLVGCRALVFAAVFKGSDYLAMLQRTDSRARGLARRAGSRRRAFRSCGCWCRSAATAPPGCLSFDDLRRAGRTDRRRQRAAGHRARGRSGPAVQHPVHQRHDRHAEGRDADALQHRQQRLLRRRGHAPHRRGPALHSGAACTTASAWCWACWRP